MLTPAQIRSHKFISAVRGSYKAEEVDAFFEEVADSYEQSFRENAELIKKISVLAQKVEEYRAEEDNIKSTLLTAQRVADEMTGDAQEKSAQMLESASEQLELAESSSKEKAQIIIDEANKTARDKIFESEVKANQTLADATQKADELLEESKRESVEQLEKITTEIQKENICLEILQKEAASFKLGLQEQYRQHLEFIEELPAVVAETISPGRSTRENHHESIESDEEVQTDGDDEECFEEQDEVEIEPDCSDEEASEDLSETACEEVYEEDDSEFQQNGIDHAIDEINVFLCESEEPVAGDTPNEEEGQPTDFPDSDEDSEKKSDAAPEAVGIEETQESDGEKTSCEKAEYDEEDAKSDEEGLPNLFSLREMALAQQEELSAAETEAAPDSTDADSERTTSDEVSAGQDKEILEVTETVEDEEETEDEGFKVYLENLDAGDDVLLSGSYEDSSEKNSLFETIEYVDDDDNDNDDDDESKEGGQPRFKGFFKK